MAVIVQGVVFRALPGDRGLGPATDTTSKNNGLPCLTRDLTQRDDELWGNCKEGAPSAGCLCSHTPGFPN